VTVDAVAYSEASSRDNLRGVPLAHLSVEVGHLYMDDLTGDEATVRRHFRTLAPWLRAARESVAVPRPRVSTCFLLDDYFHTSPDPGPVLRRLVEIAAESGVPLDYIAREAGCSVADGVPLAELVAGQLLPEPAPGTNGTRPPVHESGWLCNGERSPETFVDQAMHTGLWEPPREFGKRNHSIFLDVEMWKEATEWVDGLAVTHRTWSCPFLAAVWHLLRLGMLRDRGEEVARPKDLDVNEIPDTWGELPAVMRINPDAAAFNAYRSVSILPRIYLQIEGAIRLILEHLSLDESLTDQVVGRAAAEKLTVPRTVADRLTHVFVEG
jgi:hypothetical protein